MEMSCKGRILIAETDDLRRYKKNKYVRWVLVLDRTVNDRIRRITETQYKYKSLITFKVVPLNK